MIIGRPWFGYSQIGGEKISLCARVWEQDKARRPPDDWRHKVSSWRPWSLNRCILPSPRTRTHRWGQNAPQIWHWEFLRLPLFPETRVEAGGSDFHVLYPYIRIRGGAHGVWTVCLRWHMSAGVVCLPMIVGGTDGMCTLWQATRDSSQQFRSGNDENTVLARQPYPTYPKIGKTPPLYHSRWCHRSPVNSSLLTIPFS